MKSSFVNALLVIANLFVSLAVTQVAGEFILGIALVIIFYFRASDLLGYAVLFLGLAATVASFLGCSWIFATRFARSDRRGHLAVVWGIPAVSILAFLAWFFGTAPRG